MRSRALVSAWLLAAAGWQMGAVAFLLGRPVGRCWRRTAAAASVRALRGRMGGRDRWFQSRSKATLNIRHIWTFPQPQLGRLGGELRPAAPSGVALDRLAAALSSSAARRRDALKVAAAAGGGGGAEEGGTGAGGAGRSNQGGLHQGRVRPLHSMIEDRAEKTKASSAGRAVAPAAAAPVAAAGAQAGEGHGDVAGYQQVGIDGGEEEKGGGGGGGGGGPDLTAENKRLDELEREIWQMAGREFKITSYVELSRVLFEDLKLPVVKQPTNKVLGGVRDWLKCWGMCGWPVRSRGLNGENGHGGHRCLLILRPIPSTIHSCKSTTPRATQC